MPHTHTNKQTNKQTQSQTVTALRAVIAEASALIDEVPPIEQPMRFGNKAFRTWRQQARARAPTWVAQVVATRGDDAEEGAEPRAAGGESAPVSCDDGDAVSELITCASPLATRPASTMAPGTSSALSPSSRACLSSVCSLPGTPQ
jgi:hypothetical protein